MQKVFHCLEDTSDLNLPSTETFCKTPMTRRNSCHISIPSPIFIGMTQDATESVCATCFRDLCRKMPVGLTKLECLAKQVPMLDSSPLPPELLSLEELVARIPVEVCHEDGKIRTCLQDQLAWSGDAALVGRYATYICALRAGGVSDVSWIDLYIRSVDRIVRVYRKTIPEAIVTLNKDVPFNYEQIFLAMFKHVQTGLNNLSS